jgi:fatty-acyl-CoA synthase
MSVFTRGILGAATWSPRGLTTGTAAEPVRLSWRDVHEQAKRIAGGLANEGVGPQGSVAVLALEAADVAPLSQAVWLNRAALTMLQCPTPRADAALWLDDTLRAIRLVDADVVVIGDPFSTMRDTFANHGLTVCTVDALREADPIELGPENDAAEPDIALRQLTSGSTGMPKAVEISHANIAAHTVGQRERLQIDTEADVMVSWLPLSHDMGMIAFLCCPMQLGVDTVIVTPDQFVRRPLSWVELISRHRGTITSGPSFGYSMLARHLRRADPAEIDLSSLRIAVNGAEPINHQDMADFTAAASPFGLRPSAVTPGYGLAEATLTVALCAADEQAIVDTVSRQAVAAHRAQPVASNSPDAQHIVCVGHPVTGMDVRVVRDGKALGPREIGAIQICGPAVANSYLTADGIVPIAGDDGWFDTGDLGYLDEQGRVYVCGRTKDLIVVAGKNLYPHDIERAAEGVEGVRKGCVIALRVDAEREAFAVLAEVHSADDDDAGPRIRRDIAARVHREVGHLPYEVRLLGAGALPKTPSGKPRRDDARELLRRRVAVRSAAVRGPG